VLDNLPQVPPEKFDKLAGVVKKIISQVGVQIREGEDFGTSCWCMHCMRIFRSHR
jgi:hypothetical protein